MFFFEEQDEAKMKISNIFSLYIILNLVCKLTKYFIVKYITAK